MLVSCYTEDPRKCITYDVVVVHLPTKQVVVSSNRTGFCFYLSFSFFLTIYHYFSIIYIQFMQTESFSRERALVVQGIL